MKKALKKAFVVLTIFGMGTTVTSCDSDSFSEILNQWLPTILQIIYPNNSSASKQFIGNFDVTYLCRTDTTDNLNWNYYKGNESSAKFTLSSTECDVVLSESSDNKATDIFLVFPSITIAGNTYTQLEIYGGTFNTEDKVHGTFDTNQQFYNIAYNELQAGAVVYYARISDGYINEEKISFKYEIVAGYNAYNGTYEGTIQKTESGTSSSIMIPTLLELLIGGQKTYSGTAEVEGLLVDATSSTGYSQMPGATKKTVAASATVQVSQNTATITLTQVEIGGRTLTNLQVAGIPIENGVLEGGYQWAYTCERQYGTAAAEQISVTDDNQKTYHYDLLSGSIQASSDNSAVLTLEACVYMGEEVYNISYKGQLVQQ